MIFKSKEKSEEKFDDKGLFNSKEVIKRKQKKY